PVQGAAQRAHGDRAALPGGLDAPSVSRTPARERDRAGQRRGELLYLGRSVRHVRPRQERAHRHRQRQRVAPGLRGRHVRQSARALSDGVLRQMDGRAHRRSERRLEGQGTLLDLRDAHAVPRRGRQGYDEQGRQVPAPSRSARALNASGSPARGHANDTSVPPIDSVAYAVLSSRPPKHTFVTIKSGSMYWSTRLPSGQMSLTAPVISVATQTWPSPSTASESNI